MKNQTIEEFLDNKIIYSFSGTKFKILIREESVHLYGLNDIDMRWIDTGLLLRLNDVMEYLKQYPAKNKNLLDELIKLFPEYII